MAKPDRKRDKEIEQLFQAPDQFVTFWQKLLNAILPHMGTAIVLLIIGFAVAGVGWGINQVLIARREKATVLLSRAVKVYTADLLKDTETAPEGDELPRYKTLAERQAGTLKALDKLDSEYSGSEAAKRGLLLRAGVFFDQGKYDEASLQYQRFLDTKPENQGLIAEAREGLGLSAEAQNKLDAALTYYTPQGDFYRDRYLFAQSRVFAKKGDKKKAAEILKDILQKSPESPLKDDISNRLLALEN